MSYLIAFVFFGAIGWLIGVRKGRPVAGLVWAMLLGPFGWLLVALLPARGVAIAAAPGQPAGTTACPHCGGAVPLHQLVCGHCSNKITWLRDRAVRPSRAA